MTIKQYGGVFGRNPTFNNVTIDGELIINGSVFTGLDYEGAWNAATNTPTLTSSVGTLGQFYIVSVAGATDLNGITNWDVGDWALFNGSVWQRVEGGANGNFSTLSVSGLSSLNGGVNVTGSVTADGLTVDGGSVNNDGSAVAGKFNANGDEHIRLEISTDSTIGNQAGLDLISNSITSRFSTTGSGGLVTSVNGSNRMAIATNGDISFYEDTGMTPKFFWDAAAESLGIGTSTPTDYNSGADDLVVATSGDTGITIVSGASNKGVLCFADGVSASEELMGRIRYDHSANYMDFRVNNANVMTIDASGHAIIPAGVTLGTAVGVYDAAKTLDDYEQGTWNGVITDGTNNATMADTECFYTKTGRLVTLSGDISTSALGSVAGSSIRISGVPFSNGAKGVSAAIGRASGLAITAGYIPTLYFDASSAALRLGLFDNAGGTTTLQAAEWTDDGKISFSITYMTS